MSSVDVLLGLQWGDEGKGKIVDVLSGNYQIIARFQGGPNAGHTLKIGDQKHVLHTVPSGIFNPDVMNVIGNGVVIDPIVLRKELENIEKLGLEPKKRLIISRRAHLILPSHRVLDAANERWKGKNKIGSTLKGIGPAYMDKTGRNGIRIGNIELDDFPDIYKSLVDKHKDILKLYGESVGDDFKTTEKEWLEAVAYLKDYSLEDTEYYLNHALLTGKKILAEGAQGTLLDVDFGTYPFVTSSNTICAGAFQGLGISPNKIGNVIGIFKAYCTRVGSGPFPTEVTDDLGEQIRQKGNEFGSTTGRPRRTGWLDLPALKYSIMINGVTELHMMKADVLTGLDEIKVCTHYSYRGKIVDYVPFRVDESHVQPVYQSLKGWKKDISICREKTKMPRELKQYIQFIEKHTGVKIACVSVGPERTETLFL
ncbi:MAG: adenylosuccinate synthase [Bacteroidia bacterium]|nr:adenylosuccinate synthase [Bacteroidia bacterium]